MCPSSRRGSGIRRGRFTGLSRRCPCGGRAKTELAQRLACRQAGSRSGRRVAVVPGHPELGAGRKCVGVPLQLGQVVERIGLVQLAGVDQAHEQVADAGPVPGLVEQGVLSVQVSPFSRLARTGCCPAAHRPDARTTSARPSASACNRSRRRAPNWVRSASPPVAALTNRAALASSARSLPGGTAAGPRATADAPAPPRRCDKPRPALRAGGDTARESDRRHRRTAAGHGPGSSPRSSAARRASCATAHRTSGSAAVAPRRGA